MEVHALCAGGVDSYDSHSEKVGQYIWDCWYCHIWCVYALTSAKYPFGHTLGIAVELLFYFFFPPCKRCISDKQKTEEAFLEFCFLKQNKKPHLVVDQQLLVYVAEKYEDPSLFRRASRNSLEFFVSKRLQCWWKGKARGMEKERVSIRFRKCLTAQLFSLQFPSLRNGWHLYISITFQAALFHDGHKTRHLRNPEPLLSLLSTC